MPDPTPVTRHEEVEELLGSIPRWIIRWGITLIFSLLLILLAAAHFIQYPDVVQGPMTLTTPTPPVELVSQTSGTLEQVYVADNTWVEKGTIVAKVTSPVSATAVAQLTKRLASIQETFNQHQRQQKMHIQELSLNIVKDEWELGPMQAPYNTLKSLLQDYKALSQGKSYATKTQALEAKIKSLKKLAVVMKQQLSLTEKALTEKQYKNHQASYLAWQQKLEEQKRGLLSNDVMIHEQVIQLQGLKADYAAQQRKLETAIQAALHNLQQHIHQWQQDYLIQAPISGLLVHLRSLSPTHYAKAGEALFMLAPQDEPHVAYAQMAAGAYGKVKAGQKARIKLASYPYQEYGYLPAQVQAIARMPHQGQYQVTLQLTQGTTSTYSQVVTLQPPMEGYAEIITQNASLLQRITRKFLHAKK